MSNRIIETAKALRKTLESAAQNVDAEIAVMLPAAYFPKWDGGERYEVGARVGYADKVYKCLQAHNAQTDWTPADAVSLWAPLLNASEYAEWVQPDSTNAHMRGDTVTYSGKAYRSTIDNNVWAPGVYGWELV